jgi:monothiol glutaredoxin
MPEPELKVKVEELIRDHEVLLFMKGTPEAPQCGFSMRVVGVLDSMGVEYAALDVLPALQPLRAVTAEISDWQTFPQLYVKGELVGGADIIEDMAESGELADLLDAPQPSSDADSSASRPGSADEALSAKQELQADVQQSPPMQIENS